MSDQRCDTRFEKLSLSDRDEYLDFLVEAHQDRFDSLRFRDRASADRSWRWKYVDNPGAAEESPLVWLARIGGKIVGQFCLMPVTLKIDGKTCNGGWFQDFIVLPQYRKMGIGRSLVSHVMKDSAEYLDILLVAGTNDISYSIFKKAGLIDAGRIPLYVRLNRLKLFYMLFDIRRYPGGNKKNIFIKEIAFFDDPFNKLWEAASATFGLVVRRDSAYLNWRFVGQHCWGYRIFKASRKDSDDPAGYIVVREGESRGLRTGVVTDIFASGNDPDIITSLFDFAVSYFSKRRDIAIVRCDVLNKGFGRILRRRGFVSIPSDTRFMFKTIKDGPCVAFFADRDNWFLDYSDSDLDLSGQRST